MHAHQRRLHTGLIQYTGIVQRSMDPLLTAIRPIVPVIAWVHTFALQLLMIVKE